MSNRNYGDRTMHKATCADCGNECEVPFEPKEGRPVYCRECYRKHRRLLILFFGYNQKLIF